jgi:hypothetical protein
MARYLYNTMTKNRVPHNPGMKVEQLKNLVWREEEDVVVAPAKEEDAPDTTKTTEVAGKPGDDALERGKTITDVMLALDPADEAHFTKSGKPDAKVLSEKCGFLVSASERDELWAAIAPE